MVMPIEIRPLDTIEDMLEIEELQRQVWPGSDADIVPAHLLLTVAHNGGVVLGASEGEKLVGFVLGFLGTDSASPDRVAMARLKHCSHMLGVLPGHRDRGIGFELKLAQRQAVIDQGIRLITWTYDPLMSGNAYLNTRKLGAICRRYHRNVYGDMRDELNIGLPSDRFEVDWWVTSARVVSRVEKARPPLDFAHYLAAGAEKVNPASLDERDLLVPSEGETAMSGTVALVEIPADFLGLRLADEKLAVAWRDQTRSIFERAFADGYIVTDFVHFKEERFPRSYYVLSLGEGTLG